jgi:two-component sensor histidine kinase
MSDRTTGKDAGGAATGARHWGVGQRLAAMIVLALLPLGLLSIQQTASIVKEVARNQEMAAMGATVQAAAPQIRMIQNAQATVQTLAAMIAPYVDDLPVCRRIMDQTQAHETAATLVAYTPLSGEMRCASGARIFDFGDNPVFKRLIEKPEPQIVINPMGPVSGIAVLGIAYPVFDAEGQHIGIVSMSLRHEALKDDANIGPQDASESRPIALITFDRDGNVLTSSTGLDDVALRLPRERSLASLAAGGPRVFTGPAISGFTRMFSIVPLAENLFLLGSWRIGVDDALVDPSIAPFLLPGLMWLAALAVAIFAADYLVTRHVRQMAQAMLTFARGDRGRHAIALHNPPAEIEDLAEAYRTMTATILRDEAELENLLHQKEALLREVHHRTGNSLQLIASVLRMHLREQPDEPTRRLLENLHSRVMSLSTVHLSLYRISGHADVAVHELMADVIAKVSAIHERYARADSIEATLGPLILPTEQAVPMALLLAEVLSCFPAAAPEPDDPPIRVTLQTCTEGNARLLMMGPLSGLATLSGEQADAPARIAARLIRAFVGQLDGTLDIRAEDGAAMVEVSFKIREL